MESYANEIWPAIPGVGMVVVITERDVSYNNGATWQTIRWVRVAIDNEEKFHGINRFNGPSESGFWGNCNEVRSGFYTEYCSRYDGNRWRSMK